MDDAEARRIAQELNDKNIRSRKESPLAKEQLYGRLCEVMQPVFQEWLDHEDASGEANPLFMLEAVSRFFGNQFGAILGPSEGAIPLTDKQMVEVTCAYLKEKLLLETIRNREITANSMEGKPNVN